jgi:predicted secreted protein
MEKNYLESTTRQFEYYKRLGEQAMEQIPDEKLSSQFSEESNSIVVIVRHLCGNMLSRWTDLMSADGEKEWRDRDAEFENDFQAREQLLARWNEGWNCLFSALGTLTEDDLQTIVYIRNQGHTVMEAINRQLAHYPYHIGQMVYIAKMIAGEGWKSLSIPRGNSRSFNADKFAKPKSRRHYTDEAPEKAQH